MVSSVTRALAIGLVAATGIATAGVATSATAGDSTLDTVRQRGVVTCGVNTGVAGFSLPDAQGRWTGLDIDLCRGIAAAVLGDPSKTKFVPTTSTQRFVALQSGEVDVLTRNATQTLTRDTSLGFTMAGVNFYDGQGFMVKKSLGIEHVVQLNGAAICVMPGTTTELNMSDYFRSHGITYMPVVIEAVDELFNTFNSGRCDAITTDTSQLAAMRSTQTAAPDDYVILPEKVSKEPLGPMVRHGDEQWYKIVKWVLQAMIEAEELGITQANVDALHTKTDNPAIQRVLGVKPGFGQALGLDEAWAFNLIKAVGNYGESFDRNFGAGSPIKLARGQNDLWSRGGLMYALPLR